MSYQIPPYYETCVPSWRRCPSLDCRGLRPEITCTGIHTPRHGHHARLRSGRLRRAIPFHLDRQCLPFAGLAGHRGGQHPIFLRIGRLHRHSLRSDCGSPRSRPSADTGRSAVRRKRDRFDGRSRTGIQRIVRIGGHGHRHAARLYDPLLGLLGRRTTTRLRADTN